ncbi:MAG TPA: lamin tail domain-containing protein [Anaerohalosphaeraceae bacterium]|nr:lamin tail domain-containing protein [Anaerohalosphaeraceae bacterium]HPP55034.1 lamin tail domain-containing protein [Anaerohalosphaeraceae bacterium]
MEKHLLFVLILPSLAVCNFIAYNDCIRGTDDTTAPNVTNWTLYNGFTSQPSGYLIDFTTGLQTSVLATFRWNASAGLGVSETSGSAEGESQPRPGTPAYEIFGGIVDFSNRLIYYGSSGWWVEIEFTGLNPQKNYTFVTTAIRGYLYPERLTLFTLSGHLSAVNNSSDGIYLKSGEQTVLRAGGNHLSTTGYVVRWDQIRVADRGDGTGSFTVRAQAYGSDYRAYPFGGFMLAEEGNTAPRVNAGTDETVRRPREYLTLNGSVFDDGYGNPDGTLQIAWSQISGPADAVFVSSPNQPQVSVRFPTAGRYELQLWATDGEMEASDTVVITVEEPLCPLGDVNEDCRVNLTDLSDWAAGWLAESEPNQFDLDGSGRADLSDLSFLASSWLEEWLGSVQVTILPPEAVSAGAQWRLDGGPWLSSQSVLSSVPQGPHTIEFSALSGWFSPPPQEIFVSKGQLTAAAAEYTRPPKVLAINEFMAVNSNVSDLRPLPAVNLYTQVNGQPAYEDWIEIRNLSDQTVSLEGWYLTDSQNNLTKWRFPTGVSIGPWGYLVVYASNKDESKYGYPFADDWGNLHTNFELAMDGEFLALVRPDGQWIEDSFETYPPQRGLVSYGVGSDGRIGYLTSPTRAAANTGIYDGVVGDTRFSVKRGFFDAPFTVQLFCSTLDAVIRYTTDTTEPTETNGQVYNPASPIQITKTTCLRAAAFKTGWLPSNVDTQTYLFLDNVLTQATNPSTGAQVVPDGYPITWPGGSYSGSVTGDYQVDPDIASPSGAFGSLYAATLKDDLKAIPSVSLVVPIAQLFGSGTGIYINQSQDGTERAGSVEWLDPQGMESFHTNCGVQMQGGVSGGGTTLNRWKSYKLSFRLTFRRIYGGRLEYPLFGPNAADWFDTVILDSRPQNSWVHADATQRLRGEYVRDQAASNTQLAMGGYACHGRPVHLYLNGLYWGLYWLHERPDDSFAAAYLGGEKDDYDVIKHDYTNVVSGSNADYIALFALSPTSPDYLTAFENLKQKLDVADFIDYLLANFYLGNGDWDNKNWYATRNRFDPSGRWRWHMWDGEHVMDDGTFTVVDATTKNTAMAPTGLHQKWIVNPEYRILFADRVHKHFFHNGALTPENFAALFTNLTAWIDRAIVGESARWGDNRRPATPYTRNVEWLNECNRLLTTFIPTRRDVVLAQFTSKNPPWYPTIAAPEFFVNGVLQYGGRADSGAVLTMSAGDNTIWYTLDGTDPRLTGGAVNTASAAVYTTPLTLSRTVCVKARARTSVGLWSALAEAVFEVGPVSGSIVINELLAHSHNQAPDWIELYNTTAQPISIGGWFLSDSSTNLMKYQIPNGTVIGPFGYAVFYENQHFGSAFALSENGETVYLTSGDGTCQASQSFDASLTGISFGRYLKTDGDMDFVAMSTPTPGGPNAYPLVGLIVISEIQYNPAPDNTGDEYIELVNISSEPVVLQDWVDTETAPGVIVQELVPWAFTEGIDFTFPPNTEIPAGGVLIVAKNPSVLRAYYGSQIPAGVPVLGPFENDTSLSNGGEKVRLCRPGEQPFGKTRSWIRVDQVAYDDDFPWPNQPDGGGAALQRLSLSAYGNDPANWTAGAPSPGVY